MKARNTTVDLLRTIGLFLVIAAHCSFPEWFIQVRNFDVVLLIFLSGMSFGLSDHAGSGGWKTYAVHRFRRLVLPVWMFLIGFFVVFALLGRTFSLYEIAESFLLLHGGVLFVWVYRVFFVSSLLNPFLKKLTEKADNLKLLIGSAAVLLLNDLLYQLLWMNIPHVGRILVYLITYSAAYGAVSFLGILYLKLNQKERIVMILLFAGLFVISGIILGFPDFYSMKYPPSVYYVSYGLFWSGLLLEIGSHHPLPSAIQSIITWFSRETMNIFIWQIPFYYLADTFFPDFMGNPAFFLFLLGGGSVCAWLQSLFPKRKKL